MLSIFWFIVQTIWDRNTKNEYTYLLQIMTLFMCIYSRENIRFLSNIAGQLYTELCFEDISLSMHGDTVTFFRFLFLYHVLTIWLPWKLSNICAQIFTILFRCVWFCGNINRIMTCFTKVFNFMAFLFVSYMVFMTLQMDSNNGFRFQLIQCNVI